jgi:hypothetical protein
LKGKKETTSLIISLNIFQHHCHVLFLTGLTGQHQMPQDQHSDTDWLQDQQSMVVKNVQNLSNQEKVGIYAISSNHIRGRVMVFNTTFNNISVLSWQAILLVEEIGVP